jgi:hypothetical protein
MTANLLTAVTALEAQAAANLFLSEHLPDRFCADDPTFERGSNFWRVPVILAYPFIGSVGEVGEIDVDAASSKIVSHTAIDQMTALARTLYEQHSEAIEAAFSQTRGS